MLSASTSSPLTASYCIVTSRSSSLASPHIFSRKNYPGRGTPATKEHSFSTSMIPNSMSMSNYKPNDRIAMPVHHSYRRLRQWDTATFFNSLDENSDGVLAEDEIREVQHLGWLRSLIIVFYVHSFLSRRLPTIGQRISMLETFLYAFTRWEESFKIYTVLYMYARFLCFVSPSRMC